MDGEQPALPFRPRVEEPPPYRPSPSQVQGAEDLARLTSPASRTGLTATIVRGPRGSGKTRMLEAFLLGGSVEFEVVDASEAEPMELFAEINRMAAAGLVLMIEARRSPRRWYEDRGAEVPADLASRLASLPEVKLERPGPDTLGEALKADLALHAQSLRPAELRAASAALPRDFRCVRRFCRALEEAPPFRSGQERLNWALQRVHQGA